MSLIQDKLGMDPMMMKEVKQFARDKDYDNKQKEIDAQQSKIDTIQVSKEALNQISESKAELNKMIKSLSSEKELRTAEIGTNDIGNGLDYLNVVVNEGTDPQTLEIKINQVATAPRVILAKTVAADGNGKNIPESGFGNNIGVNDTIKISTDNSGNTIDIVVNAVDTIDQVIDKINTEFNKNNKEFKASKIDNKHDDTHFISITGTNTGKNNDFKIEFVNNNDIKSATAHKGTNAEITVNEATVINSKNQFSITDGITIDVRKANTENTFQTISIKNDNGTLGQNIEEFIVQYNQLAELIATTDNKDINVLRPLEAELNKIKNVIIKQDDMPLASMGITQKINKQQGTHNYITFEITDQAAFSNKLSNSSDKISTYLKSVTQNIRKPIENISKIISQNSSNYDNKIKKENKILETKKEELDMTKEKDHNDDIALQFTLMQLAMEMQQMQQMLKGMFENN